jgi:Helix-turn-helix domain
MHSNRTYSFQEREAIELLIKQGLGYTEIGRSLNRSCSGIKFEIDTNGGYANYGAKKAQAHVDEKRKIADERRAASVRARQSRNNKNPFSAPNPEPSKAAPISQSAVHQAIGILTAFLQNASVASKNISP